MPFASVAPTRMHLYTLIQLGAILIAGIIQGNPNAVVGLFFPLWIILLVPVRIYLLPRIFSLEELRVLDPNSEALEELLPRAQQLGATPAVTTQQYGSFEKGTPGKG